MSDALTWKDLDEKGTLGDQKIEALVDALALGKISSKKGIAYYCDLLDCDEQQLYRKMYKPKIMKAVLERIQFRAAYLLAPALDVMGKKAMSGDKQAFRLLSQVCTLIPIGGVSFQMNTTIDARQSGVTEATQAWAHEYWKRVKEAHGANLRLIEAVPVEPAD
jgi:hypothetical protein